MALPQVAYLLPGSLAVAAAIEPGWQLVAINGVAIGDILDYQLACAESNLAVVWLTPQGDKREIVLTKAIDQDLGIVFTSPTLDQVRVCAQKCLFCFVDQMPPGLRSSLYVKDDDYRLSFLSGSYLSLSNLSSVDLRRIVSLKLSPLYVSVQVGDDDIRHQLLGSPPGRDFWQLFDYLLEGGIDLHCQVVLCPGYNDGAVLVKTVEQLALRRPGVLSLCLVPLGLTAHRQGLAPLRLPTTREAELVLHQVSSWVGEGLTWLWAADEFYLMAKRLDLLPAAEEYAGYEHLENGVGLLRSFLQEWQELHPLPAPRERRSVTIITGNSAAEGLLTVWQELAELLPLQVVAITNHLFGSTVTVAGLVAGGDILAQLPPAQVAGRLLLVPQVMLRQGSELFIDDLTLTQLREQYQAWGAELRAIPATAGGLYAALFPSQPLAGRRRVARRFIYE
ncbi:MAG: DUF512 domain-containing protein [Symbiobacteriaceae bacterium]|nr:DUF512 domain-containing protein [Symbiobacteriaceae bacterium]